jgi:beta-glucanase (GH16 family)
MKTEYVNKFGVALYFLTISFVLLFTSCSNDEEIGGCVFPESLEAYSLVWEDEFEGEEIDASKWTFEIGDGCDRGICGWGNNELQWYTDRPENAYVSNGRLIMRARKEIPLYLNEHLYTSARMVTKNKGDWKYGRIDVRAKLPFGDGLWPAIWMLPTDTIYGIWPTSGEIDIMELIGSNPSQVLGTIHFGQDFARRRSVSAYYDLESGTFNDDYHVFSVLWSEDCIQFMVDGQKYGEPNTRTTTLPGGWPFDNAFHMILNIAVGGDLPGNPTSQTVFPQVMEVDYVRVYQEKENQ